MQLNSKASLLALCCAAFSISAASFLAFLAAPSLSPSPVRSTVRGAVEVGAATAAAPVVVVAVAGVPKFTVGAADVVAPPKPNPAAAVAVFAAGARKCGVPKLMQLRLGTWVAIQ